MTDTTPPPRSNDPANDGYDLENADEAHREAGPDVDDEAGTVGERVSDAIQDAIPGDSDNDGH